MGGVGTPVATVGAAGAAGVARAPAEGAAGGFQPMFVVAADDGPAARAGPLDAGDADGDDWPSVGDAPGEGGPVACRGAVACRVTSLPVSPVLANPGLAKPAPVSSRASAAAARVAVASCEAPPCDPPASEPRRGGPVAGIPYLPSVGPTAPVPGVLAAAGRC